MSFDDAYDAAINKHVSAVENYCLADWQARQAALLAVWPLSFWWEFYGKFSYGACRHCEPVKG